MLPFLALLPFLSLPPLERKQHLFALLLEQMQLFFLPLHALQRHPCFQLGPVTADHAKSQKHLDT